MGGKVVLKRGDKGMSEVKGGMGERGEYRVGVKGKGLGEGKSV